MCPIEDFNGVPVKRRFHLFLIFALALLICVMSLISLDDFRQCVNFPLRRLGLRFATNSNEWNVYQKTGHLLAWGLLAYSSFCYVSCRFWYVTMAILSVTVVFLEVFQFFSPGRNPGIVDILLGLCGILIGYALHLGIHGKDRTNQTFV